MMSSVPPEVLKEFEDQLESDIRVMKAEIIEHIRSLGSTASEPLEFFNPSHDAKGRFATRGGRGSGGVQSAMSGGPQVGQKFAIPGRGEAVVKKVSPKWVQFEPGQGVKQWWRHDELGINAGSHTPTTPRVPIARPAPPPSTSPPLNRPAVGQHFNMPGKGAVLVSEAGPTWTKLAPGQGVKLWWRTNELIAMHATTPHVPAPSTPSSTPERPFGRVGSAFQLSHIPNSAAEAKSILAAHFNIHPIFVDVSGLNMVNVYNTANHITALQQQFPGLRLHKISSKPLTDGDPQWATTLAHTRARGDGMEMALNPKHFGGSQLTADANILRMNHTGWMVSRNLDQVVTHEVGHGIEGTITRSVPTNVATVARLNDWHQNYPPAQSRLSRYGQTSRGEHFAEVFTAMIHTPQSTWSAETHDLHNLLTQEGVMK